jgi:hypothetical protein
MTLGVREKNGTYMYFKQKAKAVKVCDVPLEKVEKVRHITCARYNLSLNENRTVDQPPSSKEFFPLRYVLKQLEPPFSHEHAKKR